MNPFHLKPLFPLVLGVCWVSLSVKAQTPVSSDDDSAFALFKLNDALNAETQVASEKAKSLRESPGIITVITHDDIVRSGARDLLDVLLRVPGFAPGVDVQGVVDVGVRGNWAHEGKVLLLWDGLELNENLYSTLQLGNHYPVDQIETVEVIRGPGSAVYGGYAELAVINVHTRSAKSLNGVAASAQYGQFPRGLAQRDVSVMGGKAFDSGVSFTASVFAGQGNRSAGVYEGSDGSRFVTTHDSALNPLQVNLGVTYQDFRLRLFYDQYSVGSRDAYGSVDREDTVLDFATFIADAQGDIHLTPHLKLVPRLTFNTEKPWETMNDRSVQFYRKRANRTSVRLALVDDITETLSLNVGFQGYEDHAFLIDPRVIGSQLHFGESTRVDYLDGAAFAEVLWDTVLGNLTVGARYELHSQFGGSFVPRAALTKLLGHFHFKLLYSQAYRAPGIEDINNGVGIRPERTTVYEVEAGYQFGDRVFFSANGFDTTIRDAIVYTYDEGAGGETYLNERRTGTRGVEGDLKLDLQVLTADLTYSFYATGGKNQVAHYAVPGVPQALLGMPQHKWTANVNVPLWRTLGLNLTAVLMSERFAAKGTSVPFTSLFDAYLLYRDCGLKGLDVGLGVYNLLNQSNAYVQPYASDSPHAPLPGPGRSLLLRLAYAHPFG